MLLIQIHIQRKLDTQILQLAVSTSYAGGTGAVVTAHDQLQIGAGCGTDPGTVGDDAHPLGYHIVTSRDQFVFAFDLHTAEPAGTDLVHIL